MDPCAVEGCPVDPEGEVLLGLDTFNVRRHGEVTLFEEQADCRSHRFWFRVGLTCDLNQICSQLVGARQASWVEQADDSGGDPLVQPPPPVGILGRCIAGRQRQRFCW